MGQISGTDAIDCLLLLCHYYLRGPLVFSNHEWEHRVSIWGDKNALRLYSGKLNISGNVQLCEYTENHLIVHYEIMNLMLCELYQLIF